VSLETRSRRMISGIHEIIRGSERPINRTHFPGSHSIHVVTSSLELLGSSIIYHTLLSDAQIAVQIQKPIHLAGRTK
jgi:hypothetical protein